MREDGRKDVPFAGGPSAKWRSDDEDVRRCTATTHAKQRRRFDQFGELWALGSGSAGGGGVYHSNGPPPI